MVDYRRRLESKLRRLESTIKPLEEERKRLMGALSVLQELDSEDIQTQLSENVSSQPTSKPGTLIEAVARVVESSGRLMTVKEIKSELSKERKASRGAVYTCLSRLRDRGVVVQHGPRLWGFADGSGFEDTTGAT